jgi:hypothetical protein
MHNRTTTFLAPFIAGTLGAILLTNAFPTAHACECSPDAFWVLEGVETEGQPLSWPRDGHLYSERLALWAQGFSIDIDYAP